MNKPKISIIVPIYNSEKYLCKCLNSILRQTYTNLEIILVNDGSTDDSLFICKSYLNQDNRVILIDKNNGGVSSARNQGLDLATGEYIGFIDSDDYVSIDMYENMIHEAMIYDADIVECGYYTVDKNYNIIKQHRLISSITKSNYRCSKEYLMEYNTTNFNVNKIYKKDIFDDLRYSEELSYSEDYLLNVKAYYKCRLKVTLGTAYYYYYNNVDSACNKSFNKQKLDMLESGKQAIIFHKTRFSKLIPYIGLYICEHILMIYKDLMSTRFADSGRIIRKLRSDYNQYYLKSIIKLITTPSFKSVKKIILLTFFRLNPAIYLYIIRYIKEFNKYVFE